MDDLITALMIGLVGSFHCIGMCGPIALALPIHGGNTLQKAIRATLYNGGRVVTYGIFGLLFGGIGYGLSTATSQQLVSIALGALFILSVIVPRSWSRAIDPASHAGRAISVLKSGLARMMGSNAMPNLFLIGLLNGLLPCGLVYAAIGGAIATGTSIDGAAFMVAFGLGTIPLMFSVSMLTSVISLRLRNRIRRMVPYFILLLGVLFILRGLNLGIPYISPKYNVEKQKMECCH
jgi:sulfite exporter TauE/SafE